MRYLFFSLSAVLLSAQIPSDLSTLIRFSAKAESATYRGRSAGKLVGEGAPLDGGGGGMALLPAVEFTNGVIEVEVASEIAATASEGARGFIGIAFRATPDAARYEYIYLRPSNARVDDQVRRNHSVQYSSHPGYPWQRMRKEWPEKYEAYADMELGAWTTVRIEVRGTSARLFVNGAAQPCLVVTDLKQGESAGRLGLWIGPGTIGYFRNLRVTPL